MTISTPGTRTPGTRTPGSPATPLGLWPALRTYLSRHRGQSVIVGLLLAGEVLAELVKPWPMKFVIDYLTSAEGGTPTARVPVPGFASSTVASFLIFSAVTILGFALFDAAVTYVGTLWRNRLGSQIGVDIRRAIFGQLQRLGLDYHHSQRSGELTTRVVNDTNQVESFVSDSAPSLLRVTVTFASMIGIMFWLDWRLALVTTVVIPPVMFFVIAKFVEAIKVRSRTHRAETGALSAFTQETLQSIQVVKAFSREDFTDRLFDEQNESARRARLATVAVEGKFTPTIKTMVQAGVVMLLVFGVLRVRAGALSTGDLWIFLAYFRGIKGPLKELSSGLRQLARTEVRWDRISEILSLGAANTDTSRVPAPRFDGRIELQDVDFTYGPGKSAKDSDKAVASSDAAAGTSSSQPVLRGVNLTVAAGERVAIVGQTGAGKSTLVSLIASLYEPGSGSVKIDGSDLAVLEPHTVREQMAFVLQESLLFATSIGQNIGYGRLDATQDEIEAAAKQARIHDFIVALPNGYETIVGERGATMSGGQRQRVAIARAILRSAKILILDEPVTGLDSGTQDEVWDEIERLMDGKTTILITHDAELAARMDTVYHLRDGSLINLDAPPPKHSPMVTVVPSNRQSSLPPGAGEKLVVIGQGYVGLPIALRAVEQGFDVVGYDVDRERIRRLRAAKSFLEDVTDDHLSAAIASGRFQASADPCHLTNFDYAIIAVPTPLRDGTPDVSFIEEAGRELGGALTTGATVILESTTYPGTTETCLAPLLEEGSGLVSGSDFFLGYSPERINPGDGPGAFVTIPKVVSGVDKRSLEQVDGLYTRLVDTTVRVESTRVAELTKLLENTFRHVNIALINELAKYSHELNINIWQAIEAASTKPFGFMPFHPGPGVGGHCLPVDPSYLSWEVRRSLGQSFRFVELANDVNEQMPDYVIQRLSNAMNDRGLAIREQRILVLGLAYKPNSGDTRQSPAIRIAARLLQLGGQVRAVDPFAPTSSIPEGVTRVQLSEAELASADAVLLLVGHDQFDYGLIEDASTFVFDCTAKLGRYPHVELL